MRMRGNMESRARAQPGPRLRRQVDFSMGAIFSTPAISDRDVRQLGPSGEEGAVVSIDRGQLASSSRARREAMNCSKSASDGDRQAAPACCSSLQVFRQRSGRSSKIDIGGCLATQMIASGSNRSRSVLLRQDAELG